MSASWYLRNALCAVQGLASLAAPFVIIHTQVSMVTKITNHFKRFQRWGPTVSGLALIPLLPSLVDEPIEEAVHHAFATYWPEERYCTADDPKHTHHEKKE